MNKILIVDDQHSNIFALEKILKNNGYDVDSASSGAEGLRKTLITDFSLIILDIQMPEMDGFEMAEILQSTKKTKDIPIIFLTALRKEQGFLEKAFETGAIDFLSKPMDHELLLLKVRSLVKLYNTIHELKEAKIKLQKSDNLKAEFLSIASHELKTPLTGVKAFVQLAIKLLEENKCEESCVFLKKTEHSLHKIETLVAEMLDISKIESGKLNFKMEEFDLDDMISNAVESIQHATGTHRIIKSGKAGKVYGDKNRLEQVISNLLSNAIKYSPDKKDVVVELTNNQKSIHVAVTDYGIGIPKEALPHLFERFYRVEQSANKFSGFGLGLFISSVIVNRHGGTLEVKSELGKGSTFYFDLPLSKN